MKKYIYMKGKLAEDKSLQFYENSSALLVKL